MSTHINIFHPPARLHGIPFTDLLSVDLSSFLSMNIEIFSNILHVVGSSTINILALRYSLFWNIV